MTDGAGDVFVLLKQHSGVTSVGHFFVLDSHESLWGFIASWRKAWRIHNMVNAQAGALMEGIDSVKKR